MIPFSDAVNLLEEHICTIDGRKKQEKELWEGALDLLQEMKRTQQIAVDKLVGYQDKYRKLGEMYEQAQNMAYFYARGLYQRFMHEQDTISLPPLE